MDTPQAAIETIHARVFARLPESLRIKDRETAWTKARAARHGAVTCFLEGPSFDREGYLYCTDIPYGRVLRVSPGGEFEVVAEYDGEPNGLKIHRDGRIFITDQAHGIMVLDPGRGRVEPYFTRPFGGSFHGVNDLVFARNGDLYFTDQGQSDLQHPYGRVFRLRANGDLDLLVRNIPSPNGLVLNRTETTLYVNVTRMNAVWAVPLEDRGAGKTGVFVYLSGGSGPDGCALDAEGHLAVCHTGRGTVWLFDDLGDPMARVLSPVRGGKTTNLAYGGPDMKTLYITESKTGEILAADMPYPGQPMYSHA
jgi:gluconolactonase